MKQNISWDKYNWTNKNTVTFDQIKEIHKLIVKFGLENSKPTNIPIDPGYIKLADDEYLLTNNTNYSQAMGSLFYISTTSRPDIRAVVNIFSHWNECLRVKDWETEKRTIKYLKTTIKINKFSKTCFKGIFWFELENNTSDRKLTSENMFTLGNNAIF